MNFKQLVLLFAFSLFAVGSSACVVVDASGNNGDGGSGNNGGDESTQSGVSSDTPAKDFTADQQQSFCEWAGEKAPQTEQTFDCGDGNEVTVEPFTEQQCAAELATYPNCTTADFEACFKVLLPEPCLVFASEVPAACQALANCTADDTSNNSDDGSGSSDNDSSNEYCYDHTCNGDATGQKCFGTQEEYCTSLCQETNCVSVDRCAAECP